MPGQQVAPEATEDRGVKYVPGFSVFLSPIEQLHSGRANKRKAILNFSFPLEGNASKRQRVYEVKNDDAAPLLSYAGPTLPDLAILCRIAT
jgi:hypothetical protein